MFLTTKVVTKQMMTDCFHPLAEILAVKRKHPMYLDMVNEKHKGLLEDLKQAKTYKEAAPLVDKLDEVFDHDELLAYKASPEQDRFHFASSYADGWNMDTPPLKKRLTAKTPAVM